MFETSGYFRVFMLLIVAIGINANSLLAQDYIAKDDFDRRTSKSFDRARSLARSQQLAEADEELTKLLNRTPQAIDALLLRAGVRHDLYQLDLAEADYEAALQLSETYEPLAIYQLALTELRQEKYSESAAHFSSFIEQADEDDRRLGRAQNYLGQALLGAELKENPVPFSPVSLGDSINTTGKEYLPNLTADGQFLIYTVRYDGQEDFYFSRRTEDGSWSKGRPMEGVNTRQNEGAQSISADGRALVITGCRREGGLGSCDLYYSEIQNGQWTPAQNMGQGINTRSWESQPSLSANGRYLFFASDRPGGQGENDIWYSERQEDGSWGTPINAGPTINTPANEEGPFLHADGTSLYFMSEGHPGLGSYDLFLSRWQDDQSWSKPKNLGYPINTPAAEGALVVSLDGRTAYYFTDENSLPNRPVDLDIYQFPLYEEIQPTPATYVKGRLLDAEDRRPLSGVQVAINPHGETRQWQKVLTDVDGTFLLVLPAGQDYAFRAEKEGYLFFSDRFSLADSLATTDPYELVIELQRIPEEERVVDASPIVLRNVLFATGSAELLEASSDELNRLASLLQQQAHLRIRINGHTDNIGSPEDNLDLSEARAQAVHNYLIEQGIAADRLTYQGFGETRPIASNDSPEGRRQNRRTEFEIQSTAAED